MVLHAPRHRLRRHQARLGLILVTVLVIPFEMLNGQDRSHPVADSAAAARRFYQEATAAFRSGNIKKASELADSAQRSWPAQTAYLAAWASLAARLGDTVTAARALERVASLGGTHPVERDPAFQAIVEAPAIARARQLLAANLTDLVRSTPAATVGDGDLFAESLALGPEGTLFVGSVRQRTVVRRTPAGVETDLTSGGDSLWAVLGLGLTADGGSLWLASSAVSQMVGYDSTLEGRSELVRVSLATGRVTRRVPIPSGERGATLGDILVARDGTVYASDTRGPTIWVLPPGASEPRLLARHPLIRSPQGLVLSRDGTRLLVTDYSHGVLSIHLADGRVDRLPFPADVTVLGIDGLARHGGDLIGIQNGGVAPRVLRLRLDPSEQRILAVEVIDRHLSVADEPTVGVVLGDHFFYVASSQWGKRHDDGTPRSGAALIPTVILRLPLARE